MATQLQVVATFPSIQRDLFLARAVRREDDNPHDVSTLCVEWKDMRVEFAADSAISECSISVEENISLSRFTERIEMLLDCGSKSEGAAEWIMKYSCRISDYGSAEQVRRLLCDKIAALNTDGETIGVLKIKRRSVNAGHAKIRLVPAEDSLQLVLRHTTAQGLKAVWKSVLWRLKPQHGGPQESGFARLKRWAEQVHNYNTDSTPWDMCPKGVLVGFCPTKKDPWKFKKAVDFWWVSHQENCSGTGLASLEAKLVEWGRVPKRLLLHEDRLLLTFD